MNKSFLIAVVLSPYAVAADTPSLAFTQRNPELPPLALVESAKVAPLTLMSDAASWFRSQTRVPATPNRLVSRMPMIAPKSDLDPKMVRAPDSSTDYKLLVKVPEMDSVK